MEEQETTVFSLCSLGANVSRAQVGWHVLLRTKVTVSRYS